MTTPAPSDGAAGELTINEVESTTVRRPSRRRRGLSVVALVLACISMLATSVALWTHQVAFDTERFTALVADAVADPAVIDPVSARVSSQVVEALDIEARIEDALPDRAKVLAPAMTNAVREAIDRRLQVALADPRVQAGLLRTVSITHAGIMKLLRDEPDAVTVADGYIYVSVLPIVETALHELQAVGLIPAGVTIPSLSGEDPPGVLVQRLESALGITLPPDFGTIRLMPADKLLAARQAVQVFDIIVIALVVLTLALIVAALWLSTHRRRMVIALGIGIIVAFLLARLAVASLRDLLLAGVADADIAAALRAVVDATFADLRGLTTIILIATAIVAVGAYLWGRPRWLVRAGSAVRGGAGSVGGMDAGTEAATNLARENRVIVERVGLVAIAFLVLWVAVSLEVALLAVALVVGWEALVRLVGGPE